MIVIMILQVSYHRYKKKANTLMKTLNKMILHVLFLKQVMQKKVIARLSQGENYLKILNFCSEFKARDPLILY